MGDAVGRPKKDIRGLVGKAAADVIGRDHAAVMPQRRDQVAEQKAPRGVAVQADDDGAAPLVDIVHAVAPRPTGLRPPSDRDESRRKGIQGPEGEWRHPLAFRWLVVDGRHAGHGTITGRAGGYHSNPRNRVLSPLPKAVSSTFCPGWMSFSFAPIARAAGSAAETMLP